MSNLSFLAAAEQIIYRTPQCRRLLNILKHLLPIYKWFIQPFVIKIDLLEFSFFSCYGFAHIGYALYFSFIHKESVKVFCVYLK